jgi:hypothetical protein
MGLWDTIKNGIGKAVGTGLDMYGMYRDVKHAYRHTVPRRERKAIARMGRNVINTGKEYARGGIDAAKKYGGRVFGGISGMIKGRRNTTPPLSLPPQNMNGYGYGGGQDEDQGNPMYRKKYHHNY